jgi:inhibitor of KinA
MLRHPVHPHPSPMRLHPLGDRAVLIELGDSIEEATHRRVRAVCARLEESPLAGMVEYVPGFASVGVHYDPALVAAGGLAGEAGPYERVAAELRRVLAEVREVDPPPARTVEIPVCYGGEPGPDLEDVARHHGLAPEEVVRIHAAGEYRVHLIGFAPGFAYLGGLDPRIATPRRATPRARVPASSVGIGGAQTGVYPIASPGGWQLIGRTPLRLFSPEARPPSLLRVGDRVRFRAVTAEEFRALGGEA